MNTPDTVSTPALQNGGSFPEQGQLVEVRRRQWVVGDIGASAFRDLFASTRQGLVSLVSVDEDSLGEELQVVWQLEPGARVLDRAGLPSISGCDDTARLEAFLDAVSWGAATNADRSFLQSPFRSGASIESYQLDPVVRAIDMARVNLLIADDVGLGKTIEAGLVIQELLVRHRARTVLVVCPSSLQLKWQLEMQEKFGLEFRLVGTEYLKCLRREQGIHANPWTSFPRLITSMDWMKSGEALRLIKDVLPPHITYPRKFDILVVDEAHNVAPAMAIRYALESQRTSLIRKIAPHFEHRIFLSATPHNGYQESFTSLLELLDDQRFARNVMPEEKQLQRVMVRRLKTDLVDAEGKPIYPKREIKPLEVAYTTEEREAHKLLRQYADSLTHAVAGTKREFGSQFVMNLLKKRLFSSPRAFSITLEKHRETLAGRGKKADASALDDRILRKAIGKLEEEYASDEGLEHAIGEAVAEAGAAAVELNSDQKEMLRRLSTWAETAKGRPDSKAKAILGWLDEHLKTNGKWNGARVILFTEYRATHGWLFEILTNHGYGGERLAELHGSLDPEERAKVTAAFQAAPDVSPVRILLATDAASEGIDLQNHCNYLIHVEIPWNPNVMEQRNGRIDRHGQKKTPFVWHPVGKGFQGDASNPNAKVGDLEGDHEYLMRAVVKVEAIREDLGSVGPVIAQQIQEAMSGKRTQLDTRDAEAKAAKAKRFVVAERKLQEKIAKLHERLLEARNDFHLSPERIARAVQVAMELAEKPPLKPIVWPNAPANSVFEVPQLAGSWLRATAGLNHPHTHKRRPITFDHEVAKGRDDVVLAHLNHRLVQMCLRILRAEVWALDDRKTLNRVTVRRSADASLEHPVVAVSSRLVVTGGNHHRLHEELTVSGGELKPESFARIAQVGRLEALLEESKPFKPDVAMLAMLRERFDHSQKAIRATADARSDDRLKFLKNTLERRKLGDVTDIAGLLDELERALKLEIEASSRMVQTELGFWPENERMQLRRDVDALRARLARIPDEREQEIASIERRYSDLAHRTFPVAVTLILPPSISGGAK
jgi:superfamily II DNA or RNA helicase